LKAHALDRLRRIEGQADPLSAWRSSAPARSCPETESRLDRVAVSFRSNLDVAHFLQIEPLTTICCLAQKRTWIENAFPHGHHYRAFFGLSLAGSKGSTERLGQFGIEGLESLY
jgi:hypothetical protein